MYMYVIGYSVILIIITIDVSNFIEPNRETACPAGFTKNDRSCYRVFLDSVYQTVAAEKCRSLGTHLAVPNSLDEHYWLQKFAKSNGMH